MRVGTSARRLLAATTVVFAVIAVAVGTVSSVGAGPAGGSVAGAAPHGHAAVRYAVDVPLCAQPADPRLMRCYALRRVPVPAGTAGAHRYLLATGVARGPAGGYTPADLARAYHFNPDLKRGSETVAVVIWHDDPHARADLNTFDRHYGLPLETGRSFAKVNQDGHAHPLPGRDASVSPEVSLDLQTIRAVCHTCRLRLVEAKAPTGASLATAENTAVRQGARVVNNSFGTAEQRVPARVRAAFDHPGHVLVAATGDAGWYGWDYSNTSGDHSDSAPQFPAALPSVVAVGGTTLQLADTGERSSETVWNSDGPLDDVGAAHHQPLGASGGGCSRLYRAATWQRHHHGYHAAHCFGRRLAADVAADGDPQYGFDVYDSYGQAGWITVGGTSLSAPLIAGMYALAGGAHRARYPSTALYTNSILYPTRRFDVRSGGNSYCGGAATHSCAQEVAHRYPARHTHNPNGLGRGLLDCSFPRGGRDAVNPPLRHECNAAVGMDGPSGIGAPASLALFRRTAPQLRLTAPKLHRVGRPATFTARVRTFVADDSIRSYRWTWGDGRGKVTQRPRVQHVYRRAGVFRVTLQVVDHYYQVALAHATLKVISR